MQINLDWPCKNLERVKKIKATLPCYDRRPDIFLWSKLEINYVSYYKFHPCTDGAVVVHSPTFRVTVHSS